MGQASNRVSHNHRNLLIRIAMLANQVYHLQVRIKIHQVLISKKRKLVRYHRRPNRKLAKKIHQV